MTSIYVVPLPPASGRKGTTHKPFEHFLNVWSWALPSALLVTRALGGPIRPFNKLIANGKGSYNKPATRVGPAAGVRKIRVLPEAGAAAFANSGSLCVEPAPDAAC